MAALEAKTHPVAVKVRPRRGSTFRVVSLTEDSITALRNGIASKFNVSSTSVGKIVVGDIEIVDDEDVARLANDNELEFAVAPIEGDNDGLAGRPVTPQEPMWSPERSFTVVEKTEDSSDEDATVPGSTLFGAMDDIGPAGGSAGGSAPRSPLEQSPMPVSAAERRVAYRKSESVLGKGAFGKVYLGMLEETGTLVAVKVLDLPKGSDKRARKVRNEIQMMQRLQHPNIVRYYGAEVYGDCVEIVMSFEAGGSIADLLKTFVSFKEHLVRKYTRDILAGVNYLHENGVLHRDIKCANCLVSSETGVVKVADFGNSELMRDENQIRSVQGTPGFLAPEVIKAQESGMAADIWSLGATVYQMLTGLPPFTVFEDGLLNVWATMFAAAKAEEPPELPDTVSAEAKDFVHKCMQINPGERATAQELMTHPFVRAVDDGADGGKQRRSRGSSASTAPPTPASSEGMRVLTEVEEAKTGHPLRSPDRPVSTKIIPSAVRSQPIVVASSASSPETGSSIARSAPAHRSVTSHPGATTRHRRNASLPGTAPLATGWDASGNKDSENPPRLAIILPEAASSMPASTTTMMTSPSSSHTAATRDSGSSAPVAVPVRPRPSPLARLTEWGGRWLSGREDEMGYAPFGVSFSSCMGRDRAATAAMHSSDDDEPASSDHKTSTSVSSKADETTTESTMRVASSPMRMPATSSMPATSTPPSGSIGPPTSHASRGSPETTISATATTPTTPASVSTSAFPSGSPSLHGLPAVCSTPARALEALAALPAGEEVVMKHLRTLSAKLLASLRGSSSIASADDDSVSSAPVTPASPHYVTSPLTPPAAGEWQGVPLGVPAAAYRSSPPSYSEAVASVARRANSGAPQWNVPRSAQRVEGGGRDEEASGRKDDRTDPSGATHA